MITVNRLGERDEYERGREDGRVEERQYIIEVIKERTKYWRDHLGQDAEVALEDILDILLGENDEP